MAFRVMKTKKNKQKELSRFRADNIVHMRNFMASLGGSGSGLFTLKRPVRDGEVPTESNLGKWDISEVPEEVDGGEYGGVQAAPSAMVAAKVVFSLPADGTARSYSDAILQLPVDFYFNSLTGITLPDHMVRQPSFPGSALPLYDAASPVPRMLRRQKQDTFRPDRGLHIEHLWSVGYGREVGLPDGMQEVHDPCTKCCFILDHRG